MTLAEAGEVFGYWEKHPPVHLMVQVIARMLGWKNTKDRNSWGDGVDPLTLGLTPGFGAAPSDAMHEFAELSRMAQRREES